MRAAVRAADRPGRGNGTLLPGALVTIFVVVAAALLGSGVTRLPGPGQVFHRAPESTAELYFAEPAGLPAAYQPGQPFSFTWELANDTRHDRTFEFAIVAERGNRQTVVERGTLLVPARRVGVHASTVTLPPPGDPAVITVRVAGLVDRIFFHAVGAAAAASAAPGADVPAPSPAEPPAG